MPSRPSLIDLLLTNPHGWGNQPPRQQQPAYQDDAGNSYGFDGSMLDRWRTPQEQPQYNPSLTDSLVNIATSPAKLAYGMVSEPVNALTRLGDNFVTDDGSLGLPNPRNPENQIDMTTLLLTGFGSNAFRGGRPGLPMDQASRLSRARELGFDTDAPVYHGSRNNPREFDAFDLSKSGSGSDQGWFGRGVYTAPERWRAENYAGPDGHVRELYGRMKNPFEWEMMSRQAREYLESIGARIDDPQSVTDALKRNGYDGVAVKYPGSDRIEERVFFDPSQLRDSRAAFNPYRSDEAGLLLSDTGRPSLLGSALAAENANYLDRFRY